MQAVFDREPVARPPVSIRLDLWHTDAVSRGCLPAELIGLTQEQVEDQLGFARAARFRMPSKLRFRTVDTREVKDGDVTRNEYLFSRRSLVRNTVRTAEMVRQGIRGQIMLYPVNDEEDLDVLIEHIDDIYLHIDASGFAKLDAETGDRGLTLHIAGCCPAHIVMLEWTGYEQFYLLRADFPEKINRLIAGLDRVYRRDLWPIMGKSPARIVMHGAHFSTQVTPAPVFRDYFLPYFRDFNALMHRTGKKAVFHADAEMSGLMQLVIDAGYDCADCLATSPLTPMSLDQFFERWQGRVICWGGLPSIIFDPSYPMAKYKDYVRHVVDVTKGRNDFIFGASDNVMPGAEWERLVFLAEATATR